MNGSSTFLIAVGLIGLFVLGVAILRKVRRSGRERVRGGVYPQQCGPASPASPQHLGGVGASNGWPCTTLDGSGKRSGEPATNESIQAAGEATPPVPTEPTTTSSTAPVDTTLPPVSPRGELTAREEMSVAGSAQSENDQSGVGPERVHIQVVAAVDPTAVSKDIRAEDTNLSASVTEQVKETMAPGDLSAEKTTEDSSNSVSVLPAGREEASPEGGRSEVPRGEDIATASTAEAAPRPEKQSRREPRKYEGLERRPPQPRGNDHHVSVAAVADSVGRERALAIAVRLLFDSGGFCTVSLVASRSPGLPDNVTVTAPSGLLDLRAMQDEWYQDVIPEEIGQLLREGAVWRQEGATGTWWSLSGRELYVLAERPDLRGWVSQPCLQLGRKHAVLCTQQLRSAVEEALRATGVDSAVALDASLGVPAGWLVIRDVVPTLPVSPASDSDILNALRPPADVEISLENGIRLEYTTWLEGYPPLVRVYGDPAHTTEVRIDGRPASPGEDGAYRLSGWDSAGTHTVWCEGTSKSYSIVPFAASWEPWDAYSFPIVARSNRRLSICGPLVREASTNQQGWSPAIQLPETHPVILGAVPGEHTLATRASGVRGTVCLTSPSFRPVWALPPDPVHCNKEITSILLVGEAAEPAIRRDTPPPIGRRRDIDAWCRLILDASRKGLATEPDTEHVRALWLAYKRAARRIWRSRK